MKSVSLGISFLVLALSACVTVNVNFPESAVQAATDDYVRDLYSAKTKEEEHQKKKSKSDQSSFKFEFISTAHADDFSIKTNTETAREIQGRQRGRINSIDKFKKKGCLGESNEGLLVFQDKCAKKKLLSKKVKKLAKAENRDRMALYSEVMTANGFTDNNRAKIQSSFSRSFQKASPAGTPTQGTDGTWSNK